MEFDGQINQADGIFFSSIMYTDKLSITNFENHLKTGWEPVFRGIFFEIWVPTPMYKCLNK